MTEDSLEHQPLGSGDIEGESRFAPGPWQTPEEKPFTQPFIHQGDKHLCTEDVPGTAGDSSTQRGRT